MRIVESNSERLVLKGAPGGDRWMLFCALLGAAVMAAAGWFAWVTVTEVGGWLPLIPLGAGLLMGAAFFLLGVVTLAVGRMRLQLDRAAGEGRYDVYSPVVEVGKPCAFRLEHVDSVTLERHEEARPAADTPGGFPAQVCRARLRIRRPRRAIVLDETQNGQDARVQQIAEATAAWLGVEVTKPG